MTYVGGLQHGKYHTAIRKLQNGGVDREKAVVIAKEAMISRGGIQSLLDSIHRSNRVRRSER